MNMSPPPGRINPFKQLFGNLTLCRLQVLIASLLDEPHGQEKFINQVVGYKRKSRDLEWTLVEVVLTPRLRVPREVNPKGVAGDWYVPGT